MKLFQGGISIFAEWVIGNLYNKTEEGAEIYWSSNLYEEKNCRKTLVPKICAISFIVDICDKTTSCNKSSKLVHCN